ncbi:hypothetical protein NHH03_04545 [Stieleria sp. TO1_6]|uniref:hypothetical protein n=1 Tax=Stieleria tagensis TaxID=2956795 RepID=UPI00209BA9E3|nr:hypothetical protein [Stieleria tagensis]MCO8120997.1 hypothetical protein [Stieleria tagensis]
MRWFFAFTVFSVLLASAGVGDEADPRIAEALETTTEAATHYEFCLADDPSENLNFHSKSLLHWSNPVIGVIYGNVFVWTKDGRPEVIGSLLQWYEPHQHATHEFHSLSATRVEGSHDGQLVWETTEPGIQWKPIPQAPIVHESPLVRLRQMRSIARQLKVTSTNKNGDAFNLRLLSQPLFRYGSDESNILDGALFSFVQGTDPEVIVLIETRKDDSGTLHWTIAMARMAALEFAAEFQGQEVWHVEAMPYHVAMSGKMPYSLFRFRNQKIESE